MKMKDNGSRLLPKKSLGQHFLHSRKILEQIISASNIKPKELILEIGPGTGILTEVLLKTGAKIVAVEKDQRAFVILKEKFSKEISEGELILINGDILECNPASLIINSQTYSIVANIPYYITGAILEKFLEHAPRPTKMILLVQKEVAERIIAKDDKESILSISVKAFGTPKIVTKVPRGAFIPPPTVDSALILIDDISSRRFGDDDSEKISRFFEIIKAGFAHKRKLVIRNLEAVASKQTLKRIWHELNIENNLRAEDIDINLWLKISKLVDIT